MATYAVCVMMVGVTVTVHSGRCWDDDNIPLKRNHVVAAADYGLQRMNELVNVHEPHLYELGMWLDKDNPARYVAAFNSQSDVAKRLAKFGYASLQATSKLMQQLYSGVEGRTAMGALKLPTVSLLHTALHDQCPLRGDQAPACPESSGRYRTADGRCNNPAHPWWGAAMMPLHRFLPSHYRDGLERVRTSVSGGPLPSARLVSTAIHSDRDSDLTSITHMVMQWGQFLDHDLTSSAQSRGFNGSVPKCCIDGGRDFQPLEHTHPDCMAIPVPPDDWFYNHYGIRCLEFVRSSPTSRVGCSLGPRDQINQVTSFIDGSAIYGSSEKDEDDLRMFRNGLLKYSRVHYRLPLLPAANYKADLCRGQAGHIRCFHAGDKRVNEQPGLIALHTIWLRAHNKIATELSHINPHWRDERLYQETRRIIAAILQHITFREFLPIVLGYDVMKLFDLQLVKKGYFTGYDIKTNPTAANAFGTAAFRFGHSLVQHSLVRCDRSHNRLLSNVSLHEEMTNPANLYNIGSVDRLLLGLCEQPAQKRDEFITEELTNHLFQTPSYGYGMDLAALNIQRGRDHGLAPYTAWREPCGLQPLTDWPDLLRVMSAETQRRLKHIYRDVDDIDLFPGAMAERPVSGGLVGPIFACILAQQFSNLRKGDRFWYENGGFESSFTSAQLQQIRRVTLARILCDNLDGIDTLQPFVFLTVDDDRNHRVPCDSDYIPHLDLKAWAEHRKQEEYHHENPPDYQHSASHHIHSYPSDHKPPTKQTPSYQHTTRPSLEEHQPSYLIDIELQPPYKPHEDNKPTYVIEINVDARPIKPQNSYTTSKYPKPEEHKPTYLIDQSFQQAETPTTKRPYGGYKPSNSAHLPVEHKGQNYNSHDHFAELPSKLEIKPAGDYENHQEEGYSQNQQKPFSGHNHPNLSEHYEENNSHDKPHGKYPSNHYKPQEEYPVHHKPHGEQQSFNKPHDKYPSYSEPHEYTPSKPQDDLPSYSKPHVYTTHSKPYDEYSSYSKPNYGHTSTSKPYHEHTTSHYKPQYVYTLSIPHTTHSSKPHYEQTAFTKPYDSEHMPSTLDYNKYKPQPSKPSSHHGGSYTLAANPPHKEQHHSGSYASAGRPSSSGYHHTASSYITVFNEPTYYYLEDKQVVGNTNRHFEKVRPNPGLLAADVNTSVIETDTSSMEMEPRVKTDDEDGHTIPTDVDNTDTRISAFTRVSTSAKNAVVDSVTTESNVFNITTTQDETKMVMVSSTPDIIKVTKDTNLHNNFYNTSNTFYTEKQVDTSENINATVLEYSTKLDSTSVIMNTRNTSELLMAELNYSMDNSILNTFVTLNTTMNKVTIPENNNTFPIFPTSRQNETDNPNVRYQNITNYNTLTSTGSKHNITENYNHLGNYDVNSNTQTNNSIDKNIASENVKYITEQNKTTDISTPLHTNKTIHITQTNVLNDMNVITNSKLNNDKPSGAVTSVTQNDVNTDSDTESYEETTTAATTVHAWTSDTVFTVSTVTAENEDDWIFVEEEEDGALSLPEMPSLASDTMALKELPRPMVLEDEVSCEDWCQMSRGKSKPKGILIK